MRWRDHRGRLHIKQNHKQKLSCCKLFKNKTKPPLWSMQTGDSLSNTKGRSLASFWHLDEKHVGCSPWLLSAALPSPRRGERRNKFRLVSHTASKEFKHTRQKETEAKKGHHTCYNKTTLSNTQTKESRNTLAASPHKHKSKCPWKEQCFGDHQSVLTEDNRNLRSRWQSL